MRLNVHPFALKLVRLRPKIVCFVGKKIWDIFETITSKSARVPVEDTRIEVVKREAGLSSGVSVKLEIQEMKVEPYRDPSSPLSEEGPDTISTYGQAVSDSTEVDRKPEVKPSTPLRHPAASSSTRSTSTPRRTGTSALPFEWLKPRSLRLPLPPQEGETKPSHCYFWVTPSTSGLERTPVSTSDT